jgi:hypothetical protein
MNKLPNDIIYEISQYLAPLQQITLKYIFNHNYCINKKVKSHIINELVKKLTYDEAISLLYIIDKYKCVITGSFLLKVLTDDIWEANDIDIIYNGVLNFEFTKELNKIGFYISKDDNVSSYKDISEYFKCGNLKLNIIYQKYVDGLKYKIFF